MYGDGKAGTLTTITAVVGCVAGLLGVVAQITGIWDFRNEQAAPPW
jgi:hypothetical protein